MLKMNLEYNNNILFVNLDGYLNRQTSYKINNYLVPVLLKHKISNLVVNLENVFDVDEEGIDSLLNLRSAIKSNHGHIYLSNVKIDKIKKIHIKIISTNNCVYEHIGV